MKRTSIELSLCGKCAGVFYRSSTHRIKRIDPLQIIKEECMCCRIRNGYDYNVIELIPSSCILFPGQHINAFPTILQ